MIKKLRVGEDPDGELAELGIQTWSIDDFNYIKKLGTGGLAQVYLASEKESGRCKQSDGSSQNYFQNLRRSRCRATL